MSAHLDESPSDPSAPARRLTAADVLARHLPWIACGAVLGAIAMAGVKLSRPTEAIATVAVAIGAVPADPTSGEPANTPFEPPDLVAEWLRSSPPPLEIDADGRSLTVRTSTEGLVVRTSVTAPTPELARAAAEALAEATEQRHAADWEQWRRQVEELARALVADAEQAASELESIGTPQSADARVALYGHRRQLTQLQAAAARARLALGPTHARPTRRLGDVNVELARGPRPGRAAMEGAAIGAVLTWALAYLSAGRRRGTTNATASVTTP